MHGGDLNSLIGYTLYQFVLIWSSFMPSSLSAARTFSINFAFSCAAPSAVLPCVSTPIVIETLSGLTFTVAVPEVETIDCITSCICCWQISESGLHCRSTLLEEAFPGFF